jgi:hypothetical protein
MKVHADAVADPDPYNFGKLDPDPDESGTLDPDQDQSEKAEALERWRVQIWGKVSGRIRIRIK